jgi:hypothetical protein
MQLRQNNLRNFVGGLPPRRIDAPSLVDVPEEDHAPGFKTG